MSTGVYKIASRRRPSEGSKKRDREQTRARILTAAQIAFSRHGYGANMRDIANDAGITAALVVRYFGSKEKLFAAAVAEAFDLGQALSGVRREQLGVAMTGFLFSEQNDVDLMAMMVRAALDPTVNPLAAELARDHMITPLTEVIGGRKAKRKAAAILSVVTGVWFYRFALPIEPFVGTIDRTLVKQIAHLIQAIIDDANDFRS